MKKWIFILLISIIQISAYAQLAKRARDYKLKIGVMPTGKLNGITDVEGVKVGHITLNIGDTVHTGVTAILPHGDNIFQEKVPAAIFAANGFGKLTGTTQIIELGNIETPIILTNTLSVAAGIEGLLDYTLNYKGNESIKSVNAVVGETNDSYLNDIRGRHVTKQHVLEAIESAHSGQVEEGNVGAGTGTVCFGYKGGIGTSSRKLPKNLGGYTVGVLVQSNFGGVLQIDGVPIGAELGKFSFSNQLLNNVDGSCMVVIATDAPLDSRNLERLAKRAFLGLGKTGGIASNGSGDYMIAFSTAKDLRTPHTSKTTMLKNSTLHNDETSPLFMAAIEATEEAIINSLFAAKTMTGITGNKVNALPLDQVLPLLKKFNRIINEQ
ncbi:DmpA family aminopeptidase [Pedobacter insulae]|uniref:D-aminopeptidase n=1 Tax=Pedobacter insulae TaxID=414048 RepID=A0A1I2U7Z0_9SPHI|nr:P1 family peptidase [Pedobacter insulae]SFG73242.1 D-aminopeptidase [Pedobacter insulae]